MVWPPIDALMRQASNMLDTEGEGASPAVCHLQAALDVLNRSDLAFDVETIASTLLDAAARERVRCFAID